MNVDLHTTRSNCFGPP